MNTAHRLANYYGQHSYPDLAILRPVTPAQRRRAVKKQRRERKEHDHLTAVRRYDTEESK
jgi:hypothetical protein